MKHPKIKKNQPASSQKLKIKDIGKKPISFEHPVFCFKFLDHKWGLKNLSKDQKAALLEQLYKLSTLTWNQINTLPRHGLGSEKIDPSTSGLKCKYHNEIYSEDSNIYALRYSGKLPFIGIRSDTVFHIIGIDFNYSIYNH